MPKTIFSFFLLGIIVVCTINTKAQEPVSQSERQTVIKALETKIAELEVKRATDLSKYNPDQIDEQLVNLRKRLSELITKRRSMGKRRSVVAKTSINNNNVEQIQKLLRLTDSPTNRYIP